MLSPDPFIGKELQHDRGRTASPDLKRLGAKWLLEVSVLGRHGNGVTLLDHAGERFFEEGDSWCSPPPTARPIGLAGNCVRRYWPTSRIESLMRSGEDGTAARRPVHFAQDQSRLRREKPIARQYRRATIAPWLRNTKVIVTVAMMVDGLKAKPLYLSPQMMGGAHPYALHPVRMPTACQPAEGYLERSTLEPSAGDFCMAH